MKVKMIRLLIIAMAVVLVGCNHGGGDNQIPSLELSHEVVATGLEHPWGLAFLPDGRMLVTERTGSLSIVEPDGTVSEPLDGVPEVYASGQGGLLDVAIDPDFQMNSLVYLSYSEPVEDGFARTAVGRGSLSGEKLLDFRVIFRQSPAVNSSLHFGSRLVFDDTGHLFITLGERGYRHEAQESTNTLGAVARILPDGTIPADNPFGAGSPLYSYGHRNPQGAALNPETGEVWLHEHGPQGGDEVNIVKPGTNYGWPVVTHGAEYGTGFSIGEGTTKPGMEDPLHVWVPSIAPSGMAFIGGGSAPERYPGWGGALAVGALKARLLAVLFIDGVNIAEEMRYTFSPAQRIRDVRMGPDGYLYLLTDEDEGELRRVLTR